jgi:hypothetical protein
MASYNFLGMPGASSASSNSNYLLDQLDIKENQLGSDGYLSPGDYQLLTSMAQKAYSSPGLTPDQRSSLLVKISGYQKAAATTQLTQNSNISDLNDDVSDTLAQATMLQGSNPAAFIKTNVDVLAAKLSQLKDAIDTADSAGQDSSALTNEYLSSLSQYNDMTNALQDVNSYTANPTGVPQTDYAAYITTNSKGEITDVKIGQQGSITGYNEVKALYGGLPIYGKANTAVNGTKTFKLGNNTYSGSATTAIDPTTLQPMPAGVLTIPNQGSTYIDMDPKTTSPQGYIPDNGWAQGSTSSTFYQNNGGGKYTKYVNASQKALNIPDGGYITLPSALEQSLAPAVGTTTDLSAPITPPVAISPVPNIGTPTSTTPTSSTPTPPAGSGPASFGGPTGNGSTAPAPSATSRTNAPTKSSPTGIAGIAQNALGAATGFLGKLFGSN